MKTRIGLMGILAMALGAGSVQAAEWFVATNGNDAAEGTNWATAKLTIQAGVDAASDSDTVWVSNGVYATGQGAVAAGGTNRVTVGRAVMLRSVNGPQVTIIDGSNLVRGVYLTTNAMLDGFTVTRCWAATSGGGIYCDGDALVTNCHILRNSCIVDGGGVAHGRIWNCLIAQNRMEHILSHHGAGVYCADVRNSQIFSNSAVFCRGAGIYGGSASNCAIQFNVAEYYYGGGAMGCQLDDCVIVSNMAATAGGGSTESTNRNCLIAYNTVFSDLSYITHGGGANASLVLNCTVIGNSVLYHAAANPGEGTYDCTVENSIVYSNGCSGGTTTYSCVDSTVAGEGNITNNPGFTDGFHLQDDSACVDAGTNSAWLAGSLDLDGGPRIRNGRIDMGCYEQSRIPSLPPPSIATPAIVGGGETGIYRTTNGVITIEGLKSAGTLAALSDGQGSFVASSIQQDLPGTVWSNSLPFTEFQSTLTFKSATNAEADSVGTNSTVLVLTRAGLDAPGLVITSSLPVLCYSASNVVLGGTVNPHVVGTLWITNQVTGGCTSFPAPIYPDCEWFSPLCALAPGTNSFTVLGTNMFGTPVSDSAFVVRGGYGLPALTIAPQPPVCLPYASNSISLTGANNDHITMVCVSNLQNAATTWCEMPTGSNWMAPSVTLDVGTNVLFALGFNVLGQVATSQVQIIRIESNQTICVSAASTNPVPPFLSWGTAATNFASAMAIASEGMTISVAPGTYQESLTISKGIRLASTEGPHVTTILGTGEGRCVTITDSNAVVSGFTITGGRNEWGAGVHMPAGSLIESCIVSNNGIYIETSEGGSGRGGGIYGGRARNCLITGNFLHISGGSRTSDAYAGGGGAFFCTLENCTVVGNWTYAYAYVAASEGGGGLACTFINTIVWSNPAYLSFLPGVYTDGDTFDHSYTNDPGFVDSTYHLQAGSPCLDVGTNLDWLAAATDLEGNPRIVHGCVDLGAYERQALMISPLGTNVSPAAASGLTFAVTAEVAWTAATNVPWLTITSGASGSTNGTVTFDVAANETYYGRTGTISVTDGGVIWTYAVAQAAHEHLDWYVATNGNDAADGASWATAKQTIQAAVDEAANGNAIWVGNGTYVGGISIAKELRVQSANGADLTTIQGVASRCVTLSNALAVVSGFTLTGGTADWGGGAYIFSGALEDCLIQNNTATGRKSGDLEMAYGGGTYGGTLRRCILSNNLARAYGDQDHRPKAQGGGAYDSELVDCLVVSNVARAQFAWLSEDVTAGGGASGGTIVNCTLVGNVACVDYAPASGALTGGGCYGSAARNSIVYGNYCFNTWDNGYWLGWSWDEISGGDVRYSCSPFISTDNGNRTNVPQFVDAGTGDYRLEAESPCIDAGENADVIGTTDLDGSPRIVHGTVDMGAFEYQPELEISPTSANLSHEAASGLSFEVRAHVPWTATTNVPWLTITAGASGTTNGTVVFDVAANEGAALRAGTIAVTGGGSVCSYTVMQSHEGQSSNGYYAWAAGITNGLTNATDCAAGDGVPNLLRYAAGCPEPMVPDGLADLQIGVGAFPSLIFNRNPDAADLAWFVESADRMADDAAWRGVATNVGGSWLGATNVEESGTGNPVECTVTDPVALDSNRFLRLRVSRP